MWACLSTGWLYSGTWREIVWNYRALFTHPQNSSYHYREFSTIFALFRYNQREKNSLGKHSERSVSYLTRPRRSRGRSRILRGPADLYSRDVSHENHHRNIVTLRHDFDMGNGETLFYEDYFIEQLFHSRLQQCSDNDLCRLSQMLHRPVVIII